MPDQIRFRFIQTNGIRLHVAEAGPEDGPLVLLLHGFPEFWYSWRRQLPVLAEAGYHVVAPDQRGYNTSDKPIGVGAYRADLLVTDIFGLMDACNRESATVVGHDWGGVVAWLMALRHPERIHRLGILNVPHPLVFRHALSTSPLQLLRSSYMLFFQLPLAPELLARQSNWRVVTEAMLRTSRPGTFSKDDFVRYRQNWSQPGAYTSMLNWYRAAIQHPSLPRANARVSVPTEVIWGAKDHFLRAEMAQQSVEMCDRGTLTLVPHATHWVHHEEPALVNERLLDLSSQP